ncbi:MAG: porphobilinogen synthase [Thermodesulfovibrionales bacterium]|nr:porphobilinogen synthase [Thermodesulfovibrionales bacterium]
MFPIHRPKRLRKTEFLRALIRETSINKRDLIYPLFVTTGHGIKKEIDAMPGCYQMSIDCIVEEVESVRSLGILGVILFGIPDHKDPFGSDAYSDEGIIQTAVREIKSKVKDILIITDVCLCEYTDHGHCGIISNGMIDNDKTIQILAMSAVSHARAGADIVAPSDMMDGRVKAIRNALDSEGFIDIPIMSYSAKYASAFYGPFREAAKSAPMFGDRRSYQMDPSNRREALREVALDIEEGADIVMVKPALSYLDVISDVKSYFSVPVAAYNVSGEYAMIKAGGRLGWIDEYRVMMEVVTSIKRAGADIIITYFAKDIVKVLSEDGI